MRTRSVAVVGGVLASPDGRRRLRRRVELNNGIVCREV